VWLKKQERYFGNWFNPPDVEVLVTFKKEVLITDMQSRVFIRQ